MVPPTLQREKPATLTNTPRSVSDAQPATIVSESPADSYPASSSRFALSTIASSRGVMVGLGVTAAVVVVAWLISVVDFSREPTDPKKSSTAPPSAPSTSVAAPASPPAQSPSAVPPPATTTATVAAGTFRRRKSPNLVPNSRRKSCGRLGAWRSKKSFNRPAR